VKIVSSNLLSELNRLIPLLVAGAALVCSSAAIAGDWKTVPEEQSELILRAPGLTYSVPTRRISAQGWVITETGRWRGEGSRWPQAALRLKRLDSIIRQNRVFLHATPLPEQISNWFQGENFVLGAAGFVTNLLGELEYQRFTRFGNIDCVFIVQGISTYSDQIELVHQADTRKPLGDIVITGWYCVHAFGRDMGDVFASFFDGIGLKGFAEKQTLAEKSKIPTADWRETPDNEARLVIETPSLGLNMRLLQRRTTSSTYEERGHWSGQQGWTAAFPRAELGLVQAELAADLQEKSVGLVPLEDLISSSFSTGFVQVGESGQIKNRNGPVEIRRFRRNGIHRCVFLRQSFHSAITQQKNTITDIAGWYCVAAHATLSDEMITTLINGIEVRP